MHGCKRHDGESSNLAQLVHVNRSRPFQPYAKKQVSDQLVSDQWRRFQFRVWSTVRNLSSFPLRLLPMNLSLFSPLFSFSSVSLTFLSASSRLVLSYYCQLLLSFSILYFYVLQFHPQLCLYCGSSCQLVPAIYGRIMALCSGWYY